MKQLTLTSGLDRLGSCKPQSLHNAFCTRHRIIVSLKNSSSTKWSSTVAKSRPKTALFFPGLIPIPLHQRLPLTVPFSGQGVQRIGMATPWVSNFPRTCNPFLEEMDHILSTPLSQIIAEGPNSTLTATPNAQPAIMATSIMILRVLEQEFGFDTGKRVDVCLGHSLGEFAALVSSRHLQYGDALKSTYFWSPHILFRNAS